MMKSRFIRRRKRSKSADRKPAADKKSHETTEQQLIEPPFEFGNISQKENISTKEDNSKSEDNKIQDIKPPERAADMKHKSDKKGESSIHS